MLKGIAGKVLLSKLARDAHAFTLFQEIWHLAGTLGRRRVGKLTIFNVAGNKVRLIAAIHYNRERIYIRAVLTHEEYDRGKWKE
jgi:mRNA-degrading endonuclease HigB of HigAB toxin-antitoxin module